MSDSPDDQWRRTQHRPTDAAALRAEALRLQALGYRVRDLAEILGMNDASVEALLVDPAE